MWFRFGLFALCCFAAVNSISQNDGDLDLSKNAGARLPLANDGSYKGNEKSSSGKESIVFRTQEESNRNDGRIFSDSQGTSFGQYGNQESSTSEYNQNKEESTFNRPAGESKQNIINRETQDSTVGPSQLIQTLNNRENSHDDGENIQSEFKPSPAEENYFGRPLEESAHFTNHREGNHHSSEFRPIKENDQFVKPTGELPHNQQTGFRPDNQKQPSGQGINKPDSHQGPVPSFTNSEPGQNQFSTEPNQQTVFTNNKETETGEGEKEEEKDVCFANLGCFKMGKPWKSILRPIGAPQSPEKIQTTINFYSRANLEKPINITLHPQVNMREVQFEPRKITAIIVHGFSASGNDAWLKNMKNVYLNKVDANIMIVDWGKGAQLLNYLQVAGNTRVVGKQLGVFIKFLIEKFGADPGKFHLIGHSLGAQICSYIGKEVSGIARLTALDPAQPGFEGFDREVRLDKSDAEFVDVIHTDARPFIPTLGFGMIAPHGHVDFYMNGGFDQPGCIPPPKNELPSVKNFLDLAKYPVEVISKAVGCPHKRAYEYLIESFNETDNCIFWGHKADVKNVFKSVTNTVTQGLLKKFTALSSTCSKEDCIPVGFVTKKSPLRGVFVVTTNSRSPYCISEPGVPPETPPQERKQKSFIQKIGRKTGITG